MYQCAHFHSENFVNFDLTREHQCPRNTSTPGSDGFVPKQSDYAPAFFRLLIPASADTIASAISDQPETPADPRWRGDHQRFPTTSAGFAARDSWTCCGSLRWRHCRIAAPECSLALEQISRWLKHIALRRTGRPIAIFWSWKVVLAWSGLSAAF